MTIEEVYAKIGGDYNAMLKRVGMPSMVGRFACMFLNDPSCDNLLATWENGDNEEIFKAAHTVKGVCGNLGLSSLQEIASEICEVYRAGHEDLLAKADTAALKGKFKVAYGNVREVIGAFKAEQG